MTKKIVKSPDLVGLVGGGPVSGADLDILKQRCPVCVGADGGAQTLVEAGLAPDAVIGDFDSLGRIRDTLDATTLHHVPEQDTTDFEKALSAIRAPLVLGAGFCGGRIDHQLAAFHGLIRCADQRCVLLSEDQIAFLAPPRIALDVGVECLVSVYPLRQVSARSTGLVWPLDGLDLRAGEMIGTSNRSASDQIAITCNAPGLLIILPRPALEAACAALVSEQSHWSARA